MTLTNDLTQLSAEEFTDFVITYFEQQGYALEGIQRAQAGQLLVFRRNEAYSVAYCLPNPWLGGQLWDVTSVEVACCIAATKEFMATSGYVVTRSLFSFGAKKEAAYSGRNIRLVDGEALKQWIR
jgi:Restriction endonuclease